MTTPVRELIHVCEGRSDECRDAACIKNLHALNEALQHVECPTCAVKGEKNRIIPLLWGGMRCLRRRYPHYFDGDFPKPAWDVINKLTCERYDD